MGGGAPHPEAVRGVPCRAHIVAGSRHRRRARTGDLRAGPLVVDVGEPCVRWRVVAPPHRPRPRRTLDDPHYAYKLEWLDRLAGNVAEWVEHEPDQPLALMGDFNIAPLDTDVWDIDFFAGATHVSPAERQAFEAFEQIGLRDVVRERIPEGYTYWDYQQLRFPKNEGMRIDFILGSEPFAERVTEAIIDRNERKGEGPSDHVPVIVDLS